ncbi:MAG: metallophosphoesterase [Planctomycetia bacterium]|nr:metallophosphoesterase [Planctomycetia bacterium]
MRFLFVVLLFILTSNCFVSGAATETEKGQSNAQAVLVQEKQVRPIAGNLDVLPISKKKGDYFSVRSATSDSVMVQFGIQLPSKEGIELCLLQNSREIQRINVQGRCGRVVFSGLAPATKYDVAAMWPESVNKESQTSAFPFETKSVPCRTADRPQGKLLLKMAVVSDTHVSIRTKPGGRMHCKSEEILSDVCRDANRRKCSVMIIAGDVTDANLPEEYDSAKKAVSLFQGKLLTAPGNHDDRDPEAKIWQSHFGPDAGYEIVGGIQFLWLNTSNARLNKPANIAAIERLDPNKPAVIFSHMQLVPDDYLNDKSKVIKDANEVQTQLDKIGRSNSIIYIGHKNVATTTSLGKVMQMNVPQTTQFPAGWLEVNSYSDGIYHQFSPSCSTELEELSRLLNGGMMKGIGYRDVYSFEIWNRFVPWPISNP